jgi:hypothetical protein
MEERMRGDVIIPKMSILFRFMAQSIEATHSPTTTISGQRESLLGLIFQRRGRGAEEV